MGEDSSFSIHLPALIFNLEHFSSPGHRGILQVEMEALCTHPCPWKPFLDTRWAAFLRDPSFPQSLSLQDLLSKLGRPFREYELWALCLSCLSTLQTLKEHPGDESPCSAWALGPKAGEGERGAVKSTAVISCLLAMSMENLKGPTYLTQPFPRAEQCRHCPHPSSHLSLT